MLTTSTSFLQVLTRRVAAVVGSVTPSAVWYTSLKKEKLFTSSVAGGLILIIVLWGASATLASVGRGLLALTRHMAQIMLTTSTSILQGLTRRVTSIVGPLSPSAVWYS